MEKVFLIKVFNCAKFKQRFYMRNNLLPKPVSHCLFVTCNCRSILKRLNKIKYRLDPVRTNIDILKFYHLALPGCDLT